ncbi:cupin domain-containing protein [Oscillospiraceae bacterium HV4-5-C5C]|nr:cupin domain-containing protein [Oscillospiraceae bacterium HV4-5-C5C]
MELGERIKYLRQANHLTQEELADRCELSKGFISQLERDMTSPSIATLNTILASLGTNIADFFQPDRRGPAVFTQEDYAVKDDADIGARTCWLIPNAQKNMMEPVLLTIQPGGHSFLDNPHEGEEFGYVLEGSVAICLGKQQFEARVGESFYYRADLPHQIRNTGTELARLVWVSTPPSF